MTSQEPVAIVTGSRKGLGKAVAEFLLSNGYAVEGCSRTGADWTAHGYVHHCLDVADEAAVKKMLADVRKRHGRLDAVINNAGIAMMNHFLVTPSAALDQVLETNVRGTFLMSREAAKLMQRRRYGRIINLTTVAVPLALDGEAIYAASKGAVETLTRTLARELAPVGITCNAIGPGPIQTDLTRGIPQEKIEALLARLMIKRWSTFEDVTNVIEFLLRPESSAITGQTIYLGGA
ncbi:MAG: SDR family oxidoreductase [Candidatus Dadabacteria bacterium]|nr:MAG: SDR family oxidoreductase [Candidatus Dadabacteria bacterium]